jgi:protein TonB
MPAGADAFVPSDHELEKRVFLGVAAVVIALLLTSWRGAGEAPVFRMVLLDEPPPIEVADLPELPPPQEVEVPPLVVERLVIPWPDTREIMVPPEVDFEPEAVHFDAPPLQSPRHDRRPRPPRMESSQPVREGMAGLDEPRLIEAPAPKYPPAARRIACSGTVVIEALIGRDGRVRSTRLLRSVEDCPGLDESALEAVARRRYVPGVLQGREVEVLAIIKVSFELQ